MRREQLRERLRQLVPSYPECVRLFYPVASIYLSTPWKMLPCSGEPLIARRRPGSRHMDASHRKSLKQRSSAKHQRRSLSSHQFSLHSAPDGSQFESVQQDPA